MAAVAQLEKATTEYLSGPVYILGRYESEDQCINASHAKINLRIGKPA